MDKYFDKVRENKERMVVEAMVIIDNETLHKTYYIKTNLDAEQGIQPELMSAFFGNSEKKYNRVISEFKKAGLVKIKLDRTDNNSLYTRLIYRMSA